MSVKCGIIGLPSVGKSTLFSALTGSKAQAGNFPKEPTNLLVQVPDERLNKIAELIPPVKLTPAVIEFVDIVGIAKGTSTGEGLANKSLNSIRETDAFIHVVRCFEDENVFHVHGKVDPLQDIEVLELEFTINDLETCTKRLGTLDKAIRSGKKEALGLKTALEKCIAQLENGVWVKDMNLTKDEHALIRDLRLLTTKKMLYVANVSEDDYGKGNKHTTSLEAYAQEKKIPVVRICARLESELVEMAEADRKEFLDDLQIKETGLSKLIREGYKLLGLRTYFTAGRKEVRAWTFPEGATAPRAAAVIHSDFEKGFIRAEIYHCEDLFALKTEKAIKEAGKMRMEGKEYLVQDGDVILFHFS